MTVLVSDRFLAKNPKSLGLFLLPFGQFGVFRPPSKPTALEDQLILSTCDILLTNHKSQKQSQEASARELQ